MTLEVPLSIRISLQANGNALVLDYTTDFPELAKNDAAAPGDSTKVWKPLPKIKSTTVSVVDAKQLDYSARKHS